MAHAQPVPGRSASATNSGNSHSHSHGSTTSATPTPDAELLSAAHAVHAQLPPPIVPVGLDSNGTPAYDYTSSAGHPSTSIDGKNRGSFLDAPSGYSIPYATQYDASTGTAAPPFRARDPYPAWTVQQSIPLSKEEIEDIFIDLTAKFGFQKDSMRNMYDHLMIMLDSRSSRMSPTLALATLHADFIGGQNSNYRKWYFAAQLDLDDAIGRSQNPGLTRATSLRRGPSARSAKKDASNRSSRSSAIFSATTKSLQSAAVRWRDAMNRMNDYDRMRQIALWLLCWGEAGQVRLTPECLCFIFKCADDYYRSPECQNRMDPVPEGLYLRAVIRPLYRYLRDQIFEMVDGKFVKRERDHDKIVGYDDVNQLFWYPQGIFRIVLQDGTRLVDVPAAQRFMKFDKIVWHKVFFKTYLEKRSMLHLLVNFNRIWILHISAFWYFVAYVLSIITTHN